MPWCESHLWSFFLKWLFLTLLFFPTCPNSTSSNLTPQAGFVASSSLLSPLPVAGNSGVDRLGWWPGPGLPKIVHFEDVGLLAGTHEPLTYAIYNHAISGGQIPPVWDYSKIKDTGIKCSKNNSLIQHCPDVQFVLGPENSEMHETELCSWTIRCDGRAGHGGQTQGWGLAAL